MDSSIKSCETGKNFKPKFNATSNTKPRRYNKMMCSTWKVTVFGIVALMLAFGFATSDALAAKGTATIAIVSSPTEIRAGASVDFTITVTVTGVPTEGDNVASDIVIPIPIDWHRALHQPGALDKPGDVTKTETTLVGEIYARRLVVKVPASTTGSVEFVYRTPAPKVQRTYRWSYSAPRHTVTASPDPFQVVVGPAADGSGAAVLARTNGALHMQPAPTDAVLPHEGRYLTFHGEAMVLRVTYTPAGTMPENSTVTVTVNASLATFTRLNDSTEVAVTGHVKTITRAAQTVTAVVGAGGIGHTRPIVFTINNAKTAAAASPPAVVPIDSAIAVTADIDEDGPTATIPITSPATTAVGSAFDFTVTRKPAFGKATVGTGADAPAPGADTINLVAGANIGAGDAAAADDKIWFVFTEGDFAGIGGGATYEIDIPAGWPAPFTPIAGTAGDLADGAIGPAGSAFDGRKLTGSLTDATPAFTGVDRSLQVNKVPAEQKAYTFPVRATFGPHTTMMAIGSPTIQVAAPHGSGTLTVKRADSTSLTQTVGKAPLGNLLIVYKSAGRMLSGGQVVVTLPRTDPADAATDLGWTGFREDNADAEASPGEVTLTGKATLDVGTTTVTANINAEMAAGEELRFLYKNVTVPDVATATHTFTAMSSSFGGADNLAAGTLRHSIGIGRAPDGGGTLAVDPENADAGSTIDITLTYTAAGKMLAGSQVKVILPTDGTWPSPVGKTTVSTGTVSTDATSMTATTSSPMDTGGTVVFTYSGVEVPAVAGRYTFTAQSKAHPTDGTLTGLSEGATIEIDEVAAGSIALMNADGEAVTTASPGMTLGNLSLVFTAGEDMGIGAQVSIVIMDGWSPPFRGNNAADSRSGAVWADGATLAIDPGADQAGPWTITATLDAAIADGGSLTLTYMAVDAPATEAVYGFATKASLVSGGTLLEVRPSPSVTVREPITALAASVDNASVFVDGSIELTVTLWDADGEGAATGSMEIMLSDGDAGGTFDPTSITIGDTGHSGTSTYTNETAGEITLTASSGDLDPVTVEVEVKSGITAKSVDPSPASAGVEIMISATGGAEAAATLRLSYANADGNTVTINKGLDPVGDPVDGSQKYTRMITLPSDIPEGEHMVTLTIAGRSDTVSFEVINDQDPPMVSNVKSSEDVLVNGDSFTLSANVAMNASEVAITSVTANLGGLDTTQADPIAMQELEASPGTWFTIVTLSDDEANMAEDGEYTITVTATDRIGNEGTGMVTVNLENDPSELTRVWIEPDMDYKPGETAWIKAMGSEGGEASATVTDSSGMKIADVTLEPMEGAPGTYVGGLTIVETAHPVGTYSVTVMLGTKSMMSENMLTVVPAGYEFALTIPAGTHLIHVPLDVAEVNGMEMTIDTVGDLYDALGDAVNFIISLGADGNWNSYLGDMSAGTAADAMIGDSTGLIAVMSSAATLNLKGEALGTGGVSTIMVNAGNNLVGVPLDTDQLNMISDVLSAVVTAIVVSNEAGDGFQTIAQAGDPGDGPVMGGEGYIVIASSAASVPVVGMAWQNDGGGASSAPPVAAGVKTPVLQVQGKLVDEAGMMPGNGLNVTVRNLTSGAVLGNTAAADEYSMTFVKLDSSAAKVGDVLEIKADSANPLLGIRTVQHVVTAEDVIDSRISLPDLVTYEIPAQTELLANYPNPFNPETWIPFRLATDGHVSLSIYGASGSLVRTIELGFTPAAVYEGRSDAIYWDGRNNFGEQVSSGLYFYHLRAGDFSGTRRMVIVK